MIGIFTERYFETGITLKSKQIVKQNLKLQCIVVTKGHIGRPKQNSSFSSILYMMR